MTDLVLDCPLTSEVSAACLECREPAAEAGELIRRQLGDGFSDFFDFHAGSIAPPGARFEPRKGIGPPPLRPVADWRASQRGELEAVGPRDQRELPRSTAPVLLESSTRRR
jgi:hypothetical protein